METISKPGTPKQQNTEREQKKMYVKYSTTTCWILFCLTFVSLHPRGHQLEYASAAAAIVVPQRQTDATRTQEPQSQQLQEKLLTATRAPLPLRTTTKKVIGDVEPIESDESDSNLKKESKENVENSIKSISNLHPEAGTTAKLNDTGGGEAGAGAATNMMVTASDPAPDLMKLRTPNKQNEHNKVQVKYIRQKTPTRDGDFLVQDFKANLQELLKTGNNANDNGHRNGGSLGSGSSSGSSGSSNINKSQNDNVYLMATSTSSTIKRAAVSSAATPSARTTSMTHPFLASYASGVGGGSTSNANTSYSYGTAKQLPPPLERRHIVPEKLQYTKEITIKQGRLMGIRRSFHSSAGIGDVDQYLGIPYAEAPVGSRRFMPPGMYICIKGHR